MERLADDREGGSTPDRQVGQVAAMADLGFVADALIEGRPQILERWLAAAQRQPFHREHPAGAVADHLPLLFDAIVTVIRASRPGEAAAPVPLDDPAVSAAATAHAQARFEQGLGPVAVVTEFRLLRQEIARALAALLDGDAPPADVVGGIEVVSDALDGAAAIGLSTLSDRIETLRESFLATTLHDVRQPITLVEGSLVLAERWLGADDLDPERLRESVRDALLATGELVGMIDTLSDATRVAMGGLDVDPEPASLEAIVRSAVAAFGETARTRVTLDVASGPRLIGLWDAGLVQRVVTNLLNNALKYSPPATGVRVTVDEGDPGFARLTVSDQGIGMGSEELAAVFDRFTRAERARRTGAPGLGLGLYACRGIVTAHGGTISVESDGPDAGTTVIVQLPLLDGEAVDLEG
jgi:signal transduction histidine kinase